MKLFIVAFCAIAVSGDRLENTYLPPDSAVDAGGNGNFLNSPSGNGENLSTRYGAPNGPTNHQNSDSRVSPSSRYGVPNNGYQSPDARAAILRFDNKNNGDGSYHFSYETENQIHQEETGELKNVDNEEVTVVKGSYSYTGPDGVVYTVNYIADENGFQAIGDHIPTPPPVPEAIQKSLNKNAQQGYPTGQQGQHGFQQQDNTKYLQGQQGFQLKDNNKDGYQY